MNGSSRPLRLLLALLIAGAILGVEVSRRSVPAPAQARWSAAELRADPAHLRVVAQGAIPMPEGSAAAHASNLLVMPTGSAAALTAFWFAGDRESAPNVQIAASQLDRATGQWSAARYVVNRHAAGDALGFGVRRLGNPVAWLDSSHRIHLFVVATGWGGWAASRILHLRQVGSDNDLTQLQFEPVRVLPLSWLWNTSFLVRNPPLALEDGGMVLPVHFELGIKIPEVLRFDSTGEFAGSTRISTRHYGLQPTLLMLSAQEWLALQRDQRPGGKIVAAHSADGGEHWSDLPDLPLDNPDAAVAALAWAPGRMLLAHNPSAEGRSQLDLSRSADGLHWSGVATLEQGSDGDEYSYPAMAWANDSLWVSYTQNRQRIAWKRLAADAPPAGLKP